MPTTELAVASAVAVAYDGRVMNEGKQKQPDVEPPALAVANTLTMDTPTLPPPNAEPTQVDLELPAVDPEEPASAP